VHKIVFLYLAGGPPSAMQHYTDGVLVSTTAYTWARTQLGWVRTRSYMQSVRNGSLVGTYTTTTVPVKSGTGGPIETVRLERAPAVGPVQKTLGALAYALAFAFAPQDATAQFYFYNCRQEWLKYGGSAALLSAAAVALAGAPELTPALASTFVSLLFATAALEDLLIDCMLKYDSVSSGGFIYGGSGGGGSAGWPPDKWDCFLGSFASRCTTNWVL
jgi:hypothetical protein